MFNNVLTLTIRISLHVTASENPEAMRLLETQDIFVTQVTNVNEI